MSSITISVIMPVFNAGRYLAQALESVLTQDFDAIELICVDDGSTDNSREILLDRAAHDRRLRVVTQNNAGQGAARNRALDLAIGEYLAFVDADDLLLPGALKSMLGAICGADVLIYNHATFKGNRDPVVARHPCTPSSEVVDRRRSLAMMGVVWNKFVRLAWLKSVSIRFPEGIFYEDILVHWQLTILARSIRWCECPLYALRAHSASTTAKPDLRMDSATAFTLVENFLKTSGAWPRYRNVFLKCQLSSLARLYDTLAEIGEESRAGLVVQKILATNHTIAVTSLGLHWRDCDVVLSLRGNVVARLRRWGLLRARRVFRALRNACGS